MSSNPVYKKNYEQKRQLPLDAGAFFSPEVDVADKKLRGMVKRGMKKRRRDIFNGRKRRENWKQTERGQLNSWRLKESKEKGKER